MFNLQAEICKKKKPENVLFTDGMDGTEYQKCPSMFFILCGYIDKVYTYLYR